MPIYKCKIYYSGSYTRDIEAKDCDTASDQCQAEEVDTDDLVIDDVEVELSGDQYTDQQELQDEERRYDDKFGTKDNG